MARDNTHILRRNSDIMAEYRKLSNVKEAGVAKYALPFILYKVAYKFYLTENSVERIIREEPQDGYRGELTALKNQQKLDL